MTPDLYETLGISPGASAEQIKKAFRQIALRSHPDRNTHRPDAEERFKQANYAYSVLGDPEKRKRYDLYREFLLHSSRFGFPATTIHEKILEDLFLNASFGGFGPGADFFQAAIGPFARILPMLQFSRTSARFVAHLWQSLRDDLQRRSRTRSGLSDVSHRIFETFGVPLRAALRREDASAEPNGRTLSDATIDATLEPTAPDGNDIEWSLPLTNEEAADGTRLAVSFRRGSQWERIHLRVPPGVKDGVRLRLRNKGRPISGTGGSGDLYLRVRIR